LGVVWFGLDDTDAVGGVGEHQPLGLEGAEQVPQSAGDIGLMFATVEPSGHVVAGDLPQSAVVDGDLGQERSDAAASRAKVVRRGRAPAAAGCPSRSTSIQTCRARAARDAGPGAGRSDEGRWRRTAIPCRRCEIGSGC